MPRGVGSAGNRGRVAIAPTIRRVPIQSSRLLNQQGDIIWSTSDREGSRCLDRVDRIRDDDFVNGLISRDRQWGSCIGKPVRSRDCHIVRIPLSPKDWTRKPGRWKTAGAPTCAVMSAGGTVIATGVVLSFRTVMLPEPVMKSSAPICPVHEAGKLVKVAESSSNE